MMLNIGVYGGSGAGVSLRVGLGFVSGSVSQPGRSRFTYYKHVNG